MQGLAGAVDLVIVGRVREAGVLDDVFVDPRREGRVRQVDVPRLDERRDGRRPRVLAVLGRDRDQARDGGPQLGNDRWPVRLVFDELGVSLRPLRRHGLDRLRSGREVEPVTDLVKEVHVCAEAGPHLPDYEVDGKIVLANGLTATTGDGSSSDFFPSYWSPQLRQYVNYDGHNGYDFDISYQPVLAAAAGTVTFAGWNESDPYAGYGQMVLINHHNGYVTLYGHLSELGVHKGERVAAGQRLGISGTTGHSSGPHLHFSVFHNCHVTDPYGWTGHGKDPLAGFNGERSGYLWLPGHDPLLLNPPPGWPAYPFGVRVSLPSLEGSRIPSRSVPPADRRLPAAVYYLRATKF